MRENNKQTTTSFTLFFTAPVETFCDAMFSMAPLGVAKVIHVQIPHRGGYIHLKFADVILRRCYLHKQNPVAAFTPGLNQNR